MRRPFSHSFLSAGLVAAGGLVGANARASNPIEYPDNGSASFSRGGAWLALANEPIATHYNPAGLAGQGSGFSVEQQLNYNKVCLDRHGPMDPTTGRYTPEGPNSGVTVASPDGALNPDGTPKRIPGLTYLETCTSRSSFPTTIPSISYAWRATSRLGVGLAVVPPATYGLPDGGWGTTAKGYSYFPDAEGKPIGYRQIPNPARYMIVEQQSTILFPTIGIGYEVFKGFRVGAAFISGIGIINTAAVGVSNLRAAATDALGDHSSMDDALTSLKAEDLFVPGVVLSALWSVTPQIDVAVWGRYIDSIQADHGEVVSTTQVYNASGRVSETTPCAVGSATVNCTGAVPNVFPDASQGRKNALTRFAYPIPPEIRVGVRFHLPREGSRMAFGTEGQIRDPLHDDVFDIEVDGSYSMNEKANTIEIRFTENGGTGTAFTVPANAALPPNADRWNGFIDSYGLRVGGQWNAIQDKFAIRAGGWMETRSQEPEYLTVFPVGAFRYGMGGGLVFRQDFIDISFGYQRHMSAGLDNGGRGNSHAGVAVSEAEWGPNKDAAFNTNFEPKGVLAKDRTQFRTVHAVNNGSVSQSAHAFTLGGTIHF